jgi:hypothetical protein
MTLIRRQTPTGVFGVDLDQVATRHGGAGSISFFQGHAETIKAPKGSLENINEDSDLDADDFYVTSGASSTGWLALERRKSVWNQGLPWYDDYQPGTWGYGWINNPK